MMFGYKADDDDDDDDDDDADADADPDDAIDRDNTGTAKWG